MNKYRFDGRRKFNVHTFDCADKGEFTERHEAIEEFIENLAKINEYQQKLFAEQKEGIIFIFQAMDAAGKDGAVRAVLSCLSPQGVSELQDKMHKYAEQEMNEHPEIFEGENLKEIEKGRNSDWSKEFFVRKKAEALESLNEQYAATTNAVEVNETVLEELNKQTEETIQTMVETEAQKEFMRYAFLKEPKTPIGKLVAGAWRKFKEWWDMHKRKEVEEKTRESVLGRLAELKKETKEHPRTPVVPKKHRETELE